MSEKIPTVDVQMFKVFVVGGGYEYIRMMWELGYFGAKDLDEADLVLFTGGEDVTPAIYGEKQLKNTFCSPARDEREKIIFEHCVKTGKPMAGICRGGQFLNVMNGGKMWQDVNNHATGRPHGIIEVLPKGAKMKPRGFLVTSTHHQMMIPHRKAQILAVGIGDDGLGIATERISPGREVNGRSKDYLDYEVLFYPETNSLCFQPHPEFPNAPKDCTQYFEECLQTYILPKCK